VSRKLLVVTTLPAGDALRARVREQAGDEAAEVRVVAPAADVSPLEWLASDEDEARDEAAETAEESARAVAGEARVAEAGVGDTDPVQAIEDALREFPADEVIVVTRAGEEAGWLERGAAGEARERFGVPVSHLVVDDG
jgi:hypothetical protein